MIKKIRWDLIGIYGSVIAVLIGVYSVIKAGGPNSIYIAIAMLIVFGGMGFFFYNFLWGPRLNAKRLQKNGISAKAKILEIRDTNITINNNPQVKLILEIKNNNGEIYTTSSKVIIPRLKPGLYKPGMELPVKIDPKNEKNIIIVTNNKV